MKTTLSRKHLLAAEVFGYSYDHYAEHLEDGHIRFRKLMPADMEALERAERENWDASHLAKVLEIDKESVESFRRSYSEAKDIVDAPNPAESFRRGVRCSIKHAVSHEMSDEAIEKLVVQICYRAADLGYLVDVVDQRLSDCSEALRKE